MRVMAIDYGDARTGIAVSDVTATLVGEAFVLRVASQDKLTSAILSEAEARGVACLVVGYPRNMDGTAGHRAHKTEALVSRLKSHSDLPVHLWDERRTSMEAHRILHESGKHGKKNKALVDAVAATLILEGYLMRQQTDRSTQP